jgi:hypothetical protein
MDIIIPTYGRAKSQASLGYLTNAGLRVTLVVQAREAKLYDYLRDGNPNVEIHVLPVSIETIAPTRQYILEEVGHYRRFVMVDDDLTFFRRRGDDRTKLRDILPEELRMAFMDLDDQLTVVPHAGLAAREGANRNTETYLPNTRIMRVLGYDRETLLRKNIRFDRLEVMEDFDVALQLLELGLPNVIVNNYAHNQAGSGAAGGCSHFRTPELHARNAYKLRELHPDFVKVVEKTTAAAWGGGTRTDVNIQWKKAYASHR